MRNKSTRTANKKISSNAKEKTPNIHLTKADVKWI